VKIAAAALVAAYAGLVAAVRPFTWPAFVLTAIPALVIVGLSLPRMVRTERPAPVRGVGLWVGLATAVVLWELVAYVQSPRDEHPTLSSMLDALESNPLARAVLFVAWLALGWELARR